MEVWQILISLCCVVLCVVVVMRAHVGERERALVAEAQAGTADNRGGSYRIASSYCA